MKPTRDSERQRIGERSALPAAHRVEQRATLPALEQVFTAPTTRAVTVAPAASQ